MWFLKLLSWITMFFVLLLIGQGMTITGRVIYNYSICVRRTLKLSEYHESCSSGVCAELRDPEWTWIWIK